MLDTESPSTSSLQSELRKAENREKIAQCKLNRLKLRFNTLYDEVATNREDLTATRNECQELQALLKTVQEERDRASSEAIMWRTQLFERFELLDETKQQLKAAERELEAAWERAGQASESHQTSHEELKKRDRERLVFKIKIGELQQAQKDSQAEVDELLGSLTDAQNAITSLQRSNDLHQRENEGLKSIGASLTERLTALGQQRDAYKAKLLEVSEELNLERAQSEHLLNEVNRLKDELYETKGKLVTLQIESDVRGTRRLGQENSASSKGEKYAKFPAAECELVESSERSILSRAGKKMSGWFKLSDSESKISNY